MKTRFVLLITSIILLLVVWVYLTQTTKPLKNPKISGAYQALNFFSEQRAKVKARRYAWESTVTLQANYIHLYENKVSELMSELEKYRESIQYYEQTGKHLADQLIRSAQENYSAGEIDFFKFAQSMDNAIEIELNYLDNLFQYNTLVLEINYMTL